MRVPPHCNLLIVWAWILRRLIKKGCKEIVWTSYFRPRIIGENGIHSTDPCQALDWYPVGWGLSEVLEFENETNNTWDYGKTNPRTGKRYKVLHWHNLGKAAHYHTQVRDETYQPHNS